MRTKIHHITLMPGVKKGESLRFIEDACIHIEDEWILYAGEAAQAPGFSADILIDGKGSLAMPGLANAHTHVAMTLLRGFGGGLHLMDWLTQKIFPAEDRLTPEFVRVGSLLGMAEMLRFGVTACADMYFFMDSTAEAAATLGMRASLCRAVVGDVEDNGQRLAEAEALVKRWHGGENGRLRVLLGPHAEYTTTPTLVRHLAQRAGALGVGIHTHVSETQAEVQGCFERWGLSPVAYFAREGLFDLPTIAAHCVVTSAEDRAILAEKGVHVCHNPVSNLKLASGVMALPQMLEQGVSVCLGTDGASSNNSLNLWEELRLAALLHKGVSRDPLCVDEAQTLHMATCGGMQAMGYDKVGLIQPGWHADLILVDQKAAHQHPVNDRAANLVYSTQGSDVWLTMIDGRICYQDGQWPGLDLDALTARAQEIAQTLTQGL